MSDTSLPPVNSKYWRGEGGIPTHFLMVYPSSGSIERQTASESASAAILREGATSYERDDFRPLYLGCRPSFFVDFDLSRSKLGRKNPYLFLIYT